MYFLNRKYAVFLTNERYRNYKSLFDVIIKNKETREHVKIEDYFASPMLTTEPQRIKDALSFIVTMASSDMMNSSEKYGIYEKLHSVMPDDDIEALQLHFYDEENGIFMEDE